jgi:divalent metal cation (Fe/Co/Zn/Cd) transporter
MTYGKVALSIIIGILGLFLICVGIVDILKTEREADLDWLFTVSLVSIIFCGALAIIKFKYATDLDSESMYKDGICSLIGVCLSASLLLTTAIIESFPAAWYIDPIASLVLGVGAAVYGFKVVIEMVFSGVPIFHRDWWGTSDGETSDNEIPEMQTDASVGQEKIDEHEVI